MAKRKTDSGIQKVIDSLSPKTRTILQQLAAVNPSLALDGPLPAGVTKGQVMTALAELLLVCEAGPADLRTPSPKRSAASRKQGAPASGTVLQLRIDLNSIRPPIWRRVTVPADITLADLHVVIQLVMGWTNSHWHAFEADGVQYAVPGPYSDDEDMDMEDARKCRLDSLVSKRGDRISYTYDFGDAWDHTVKVEKVFAPDAGQEPFHVLDGKRACPPEDCGGPYGYPEFLETLADPEALDHEETVEWAGEFDPEAFEVADADAALQHTFRRRGKAKRKKR